MAVLCFFGSNIQTNAALSFGLSVMVFSYSGLLGVYFTVLFTAGGSTLSVILALAAALPDHPVTTALYRGPAWNCRRLLERTPPFNMESLHRDAVASSSAWAGQIKHISQKALGMMTITQFDDRRRDVGGYVCRAVCEPHCTSPFLMLLQPQLKSLR